MNSVSPNYWDHRAVSYDNDHGSAAVRALAQADVVRVVRNATPTAVVDVGCGAGHLGRALKEALPGSHIYLADSSPQMLTKARTNLTGYDGITTIVTDMTDLSAIATHSVDAYVSTFALHHLPNGHKLAALREARRVLRAGGLIAIADEVISSRALLQDPQALLRRVAEVFYPHLAFPAVEAKLAGLTEYPIAVDEMNDLVIAAGFTANWTPYCDIAALCVGTIANSNSQVRS